MAELKLTVRFPKEYQLNKFINMLAWMELCGNVGHCTDFIVVMDGDGTARPKFIFETEEEQKQFEELRRQLCKEDLSTIPNVRNYGNADILFGID